LEQEQAYKDSEGNVKFFKGDNCSNSDFAAGDFSSKFRFDQGLNLETFINAPAVMVTVTIERFAMNGEKIATLKFNSDEN